MSRNSQRKQYDKMMNKDSEIRMSSYLEIDELRLEINKLKEEIEAGDLSEKTKNRVNELELLLNVKLSLAYDRD